MPLAIAFLAILYDFGTHKGNHLGLFFVKIGATLMGGYGLVLCVNESYTNNLTLSINFDHIAAYTIKKRIQIGHLLTEEGR